MEKIKTSGTYDVSGRLNIKGGVPYVDTSSHGKRVKKVSCEERIAQALKTQHAEIVEAVEAISEEKEPPHAGYSRVEASVYSYAKGFNCARNKFLQAITPPQADKPTGERE